MGLYINWRYFSCNEPFSNGVSGVSSIFRLVIGYSNRTFYYLFWFSGKSYAKFVICCGHPRVRFRENSALKATTGKGNSH